MAGGSETPPDPQPIPMIVFLVPKYQYALHVMLLRPRSTDGVNRRQSGPTDLWQVKPSMN